MSGKRGLTDNERFWAKVDRSGECWNWKGPTVRNKSGHRGVSWQKASNRWIVQVMKEGTLHSAVFTDLEEAAAAAVQIRASLYGKPVAA